MKEELNVFHLRIYCKATIAEIVQVLLEVRCTDSQDGKESVSHTMHEGQGDFTCHPCWWKCNEAQLPWRNFGHFLEVLSAELPSLLHRSTVRCAHTGAVHTQT